MKRFLVWTAGGLGIIALLGLCGLIWVGYSLNKSLEPKTDPRLYSQVVSVRAQASLRYVFLPSAVDPEAAQVAFFHVPGFLQGGDIVCLRLRLPEKKVARILAELQASGRTEVHDFGDIPKPQCYPAFGQSKRPSKDLSAGVIELPPGFRVFLFKSDLESIKKNWNHNFMAFTAVSLERSEVVYYADNW